MASSPGSGSFRHAGRVVDPSVRDDGELEPKLELADDAPRPEPEPPPPDAADEPVTEAKPSPEATAAETEPEPSPEALATEPDPPSPEATEPEPSPEALATEPDPPPAPAPVRGGHKVRERLLAKAEMARRQRELENAGMAGQLDAVGRSEASDESDTEPEEPPTFAGRPPAAPFIARSKGQLSPNLVFAFGTLMGIAVVLSVVALAVNLERAPGPRVEAPAPNTPSAEPPRAQAPQAKPKRVRKKIPGPWRIQDVRGDPALRVVEGKIGTDSFLKAVTQAGVQEREVYRILIAMKGIRDFDKCGKNDRFIALIERRSGRLKAFEYIVGPEEIYQAREGQDGLLKGSQLDLKVERAQVSGVVVYDGKSFDASAELAGFDPGLSKVVARALDGHGSLAELERNTVLRIIAQEITVLGEFARYAGVEALELRPPGNKEPLRLYYYDVPGLRGYYDKQGRAPYQGGWRKPIKDAPVTSPFNPKRLHPILKKVVPHNGTDFGAPTGTPVGAASYGTVSFMGWAGPSGNLVKIEHPGGVETGYAHLSRFREGLKVGDKVKRLEIVGYVGSTGRSTGPHLHFTASRDGKFFDAETLNLDGMRALTKDERVGFAPVMAKYDALLDALPLPDLPPEPAAATRPASDVSTRDVSADPLAGEDDEEDVPGARSPSPAPAAPPSPSPAPAPAPAAATPSQPATKTGSAIYLTDKELLQMQSASDDGEVSE